MSLSTPGKFVEVSNQDIDKLSQFANQIAGVINNAQLLKLTEEAKDQAEIEKGIALVAQTEAEKAKQETEFFHRFSQVINSENNLDNIFNLAAQKLTEKLRTDFYALQLIEEKKKELYIRCFSGIESENIIKKYRQLKMPLDESIGSVFLTYSSKKTFYFKGISKIPKEKLAIFDKHFMDDFNLAYTFQIPLVIKNQVIGICHINSLQNKSKRHSNEDIRFAEAICEQLAIAVNNSNLYEQTEKEREKSEKLLLNILPKDIAEELKEHGSAEPELFENVSVMFTDFKGFTQIAEKLTPQELVKDLDACFIQFDKITERFGLEKLKTIGDSYMCAGGIPRKNKTNAVDCALAALEIQAFMNLMKNVKEMQGLPYWELRLGIHTGSLVAGVIGEKKFTYDVWGDTVNTASRMESSGTPGKINISGSTYELVKQFFDCEHRGQINAKNKGLVDMYYLNGLKTEYSKDGDGKTPNGKFWSDFGHVSF